MLLAALYNPPAPKVYLSFRTSVCMHMRPVGEGLWRVTAVSTTVPNQACHITSRIRESDIREYVTGKLYTAKSCKGGGRVSGALKRGPVS
jgi:hypothetical protein